MMKSMLRFIPLAIVAALAFVAISPQSADADQVCWDAKGEICIELLPDTDTNPVGTDHTVTASLTLDGDPFGSNLEIGFFILSGPNAGQNSVFPDDENGEAIYTYTGDGGAGTDQIVAFACEIDGCLSLISCLQQDPTCIDDITDGCQPSEQLNGPARPLNTTIFCVGPVEVAKTWEDPTPTPSGTPVLAPATVAPSPTPAQLPQSGGDEGGTDSTWIAVLAVAAVIGASSGALALARRRISR